jgi:uncharacterized protein
MRPGPIAALLALVIAFGTSAQAASFSCAKPRESDEKAICADRRLNDMDVELFVRLDFARRLATAQVRATLADDQHAWLMARKACGGDKACLVRRYGDRLEEVKGVIDKALRRR